MTSGNRAARQAIVAAALALGLIAAGCTTVAGSNPQTGTPRSETVLASATSPEPLDLAGAAASNAFGFDLMRTELAEKPSAGNVVISPLSVHAALSMALQGAAGNTAAEMLRTLHLSSDAAAAASSYRVLLAALDERSKEQTLTVANALWIDSATRVKPEFLNANRISFGASVQTLDFSHTDPVPVVNAWVAEKTHGMITHILDKRPKGGLVIGDAIYFKAQWQRVFEKAATGPQPFHLDASRTADVPMMHAEMQLPIVTDAGFSATRLDYKGGDSAAYLILPSTGHSLDSVLSGLTSSKFANLRRQLDSTAPTLTALALPKFDTTVGADLKKPLAEMGMPTAFDQYTADFSGMATLLPGQTLYIDQALHKARLKVEEKGTEAAAATIIVMQFGSAMSRPEPTPIPFVCDHPFALAIVDKASGAVLFLAAVRNPNEK